MTGRPKEDISLYGSAGERFREIRELMKGFDRSDL
ncbi:MAG: hypothetical protein ACI9YT_001566 [Halobacteriales archaeon]|jgi:hypothetical protein